MSYDWVFKSYGLVMEGNTENTRMMHLSFTLSVQVNRSTAISRVVYWSLMVSLEKRSVTGSQCSRCLPVSSEVWKERQPSYHTESWFFLQMSLPHGWNWQLLPWLWQWAYLISQLVLSCLHDLNDAPGSSRSVFPILVHGEPPGRRVEGWSVAAWVKRMDSKPYFQKMSIILDVPNIQSAYSLDSQQFV